QAQSVAAGTKTAFRLRPNLPFFFRLQSLTENHTVWGRSAPAPSAGVNAQGITRQRARLRPLAKGTFDMAKLTRAQRKAHAEAERILSKDRLTEDEREFVFNNWHEGADFNNAHAGAFFTPYDMAADFAIDAGQGRVIDLCAGIGVLSYFTIARSRWATEPTSVTCIERNPRYVEIGKKLVPDAHWICADVFDWREWWHDDLGGKPFDWAIGNPPFGRVRRTENGPRYHGPDFEFHVIDIASQMADYGTFIIPQQSASFQYSGRPYYERRTNGRGVEFEKLTGLVMESGAGVDTSIFKDEWKDTSIICEIACFEFAEARERREREIQRIAANHVTAPARPAEQLAFF
ncbi:hypothetical protein, partial [Ochrobactrum sp. CGA5]|uniref:hypothetical protein n=1 Tax=Ochrobactrum sp. CGA5 TaxID=2583453 RepID=UPI001FFE9987